jgi:hypothetical protein
MKKFYTLCCATALCTMVSAKIWRINNVAGVVADFTTMQAAHDNASVNPGDTFHIEPSITLYGALTMTKRLTIISIGNFLSSTPTAQYSPVTGTISSITINNVSASNSVFHCNVSSTVSITNANNIRIERSRLAGALVFNQSSSNIVMNCYLYYVDFSNSNSNVFTNNIVSYYLDVNTTASATITQNVFFSETAALTRPMNNSTFQNNILNKLGGFTFTNCIVENNIAANATLPAGNGNQNSVSMASVFVNPNGNADVAFQLQNANPNPAKNAGIGGVDCGAFGGASPFKLAVQPAIPAIYKLTAPAAPTGSTMNVVFSTRSNN